MSKIVSGLKKLVQSINRYFETLDILAAAKVHKNKEVGMSALTGLLTGLLPGVAIVTIAVNLGLLMVHKLDLVLWVMYGILVLVVYFASHIYSVTLKNYQVIDDINYDKITYTLSLVINVVIFIVVLSVIVAVT